MNRADVDIFEKLKGQLDSLYQEISLLAKKAPNDALNAFKLKFINAALVQCNEFLGEKYLPFKDFQIFSVDELPTNSDVTFIIGQYIECAEKFRSDNIEFDDMTTWYWKIKDGRHKIETAPPKRLSNR